jgi:hypothetical protein
MARSCFVTADSDPERRWIEIRAAASVLEAACFYESCCAAPPMGCKPLPRPGAGAIFAVRVNDREYRVRRERPEREIFASREGNPANPSHIEVQALRRCKRSRKDADMAVPLRYNFAFEVFR